MSTLGFGQGERLVDTIDGTEGHGSLEVADVTHGGSPYSNYGGPSCVFFADQPGRVPPVARDRSGTTLSYPAQSPSRCAPTDERLPILRDRIEDATVRLRSDPDGAAHSGLCKTLFSRTSFVTSKTRRVDLADIAPFGPQPHPPLFVCNLAHAPPGSRGDPWGCITAIISDSTRAPRTDVVAEPLSPCPWEGGVVSVPGR